MSVSGRSLDPTPLPMHVNSWCGRARRLAPLPLIPPRILVGHPAVCSTLRRIFKIEGKSLTGRSVSGRDHLYS